MLARAQGLLVRSRYSQRCSLGGIGDAASSCQSAVAIYCYYATALECILEQRDPSVCLSHGVAAKGVRTLAACSLAIAGHQRHVDCGSVRGRAQIRRDFCRRRRTAIGGGVSSRRPGGDTLLLWLLLLFLRVGAFANRIMLHVFHLWAYYNCDSSTIRVRYKRDSSTIQHPTRSYVLSSNNEHVNSFALLQDVVANQRSRGGASIYTMP